MPRDRNCDSCGELFSGNRGGMVNGIKFFFNPPAFDRPSARPDRLEVKINLGFDICNECLEHYLTRALEQEFSEVAENETGE